MTNFSIIHIFYILKKTCELQSFEHLYDAEKLMKNYHKYVLVYLGLVKVWPLDFNCTKIFHAPTNHRRNRKLYKVFLFSLPQSSLHSSSFHNVNLLYTQQRTEGIVAVMRE